jgi:hypothetical protein
MNGMHALPLRRKHYSPQVGSAIVPDPLKQV